MKKTKAVILVIFLIVVIFVTLLVAGKFPKIYTRNKEIKMSEELGNKLNDNFSKIMEYATFNNTNVTGAQIILAQDVFFKDNVSISVKTIGDSEYKNYTKDKPYIAKEAKGSSIINNNAKFASTLVKDKNGTIVEIKLEEIK